LINIILPIAKVGVSIPGVVGLGFVVGALSGLFGVGGGFLITPMLNVLFGVPYNFAVGSGLLQMVGTSTAAFLSHKTHGNVDYRLALFLLAGSLIGAEIGARILNELKGLGSINLFGHPIDLINIYMNVIYIVFLGGVGIFMFKEARAALKKINQNPGNQKDKAIAITRVGQKVQAVNIPPLVSLPTSEIKSISLWIIVFFGFTIGVLSGLLGVGGGFILLPILIYLVGAPTNIAVGTSLFQMIFTSGYGSITHLFKGNIDFLLVGLILSGSLLGSKIGVMLNNRMKKVSLRYYFSYVVFTVILIIVIKFFWSLKIF